MKDYQNWLKKKIDHHQSKGYEAEVNYQETGMPRYLTTKREHENYAQALADSLRTTHDIDEGRAETRKRIGVIIENVEKMDYTLPTDKIVEDILKLLYQMKY